MAAIGGETHGGRRESSGRKRKHERSSSVQRTWNSRHKRVYLSLTIFQSWKEAKVDAGYRNSGDNDFAAHLLSLEYRRRYVFFNNMLSVFLCIIWQHFTKNFTILFTARAELKNNWDEIQTEDSENAHREGAVMEGKKFTYYIFKVLYTCQIIYNTINKLQNIFA